MAFLVSTMTIYTIYYYTQIGKLDSSVVALLKDLPNTFFGKIDKDARDKNLIRTAGIDQALLMSQKSDTHFKAFIPGEHFVSFNTTYSKDNLELFYEGFVTKFPNHPPIQFSD